MKRKNENQESSFVSRLAQALFPFVHFHHQVFVFEPYTYLWRPDPYQHWLKELILEKSQALFSVQDRKGLLVEDHVETWSLSLHDQCIQEKHSAWTRKDAALIPLLDKKCLDVRTGNLLDQRVEHGFVFRYKFTFYPSMLSGEDHVIKCWCLYHFHTIAREFVLLLKDYYCRPSSLKTVYFVATASFRMSFLDGMAMLLDDRLVRDDPDLVQVDVDSDRYIVFSEPKDTHSTLLPFCKQRWIFVRRKEEVPADSYCLPMYADTQPSSFELPLLDESHMSLFFSFVMHFQ